MRAATVILAERQDVVVIARTGDGKSAVFQLLLATDKTLIVISPILGLIYEQVEFMESLGIKAVGVTAEKLREDKNLWKDIDKGKFRVIFLPPEQLLTPASYFWHKMVSNTGNKFLKRLAAVVVDEAHVVWKWGESGFRKEYKNIGDLRAFLTSTPFLLMSATITPNVRGYLHRTLKMMKPTVISRRSIRRANVSFVCAKMRTQAPASADSWKDLDFLVPSGTKIAAPTCIPKSMVFVDNRNTAQYIANHLRLRLDSEETMESRVGLITVYTAALEINTRNVIMGNFRTGKVRVLVCTDAAGMGMDIPDVQVVIQYGVSVDKGTLSLADLYQRLGRCARDQSIDGLAIVFAEEKFMLPSVVDEPPDAIPLYQEFKMEANFNSRGAVQEFTGRMFDKTKTDNPFSMLDPGLCWVVNTYGCRVRAILAIFEDPETYAGFDRPCKCDNCFFPRRESHLNFMEPQEMSKVCPLNVNAVKTRAAANPGSNMNQMRVLQDERARAVVEFRQLAAIGYQSIQFSYSMKGSIRYEDTCAYAEDEKERMHVQQTLSRHNKRPADQELQAAVTKELQAGRRGIYVYYNGIESDYTDDMILPDKQIALLAKRCRNITTLQDLRDNLGNDFDIDSSALADHKDNFVDFIRQAVFEYDQKLEREALEVEATANETQDGVIIGGNVYRPNDAVENSQAVASQLLQTTESQRTQATTSNTRIRMNKRYPPLPPKQASDFDLTTKEGRKAFEDNEYNVEYEKQKLERAEARKVATDKKRAAEKVAKRGQKAELERNQRVKASQNATQRQMDSESGEDGDEDLYDRG